MCIHVCMDIYIYVHTIKYTTNNQSFVERSIKCWGLKHNDYYTQWKLVPSTHHTMKGVYPCWVDIIPAFMKFPVKVFNVQWCGTKEWQSSYSYVQLTRGYYQSTGALVGETMVGLQRVGQIHSCKKTIIPIIPIVCDRLTPLIGTPWNPYQLMNQTWKIRKTVPSGKLTWLWYRWPTYRWFTY